MEQFYTDKGKVFECQIQVEGADIADTKARLILMFENKRNMIFFGEVQSNGKCEIAVPALKEFKEGVGTAVLEVISESTLFEPWESKFQLKASKRVQVEVKENRKPLIEEINQKPVITVTKEGKAISAMMKRKILDKLS